MVRPYLEMYPVHYNNLRQAEKSKTQSLQIVLWTPSSTWVSWSMFFFLKLQHTGLIRSCCTNKSSKPLSKLSNDCNLIIILITLGISATELSKVEHLANSNIFSRLLLFLFTLTLSPKCLDLNNLLSNLPFHSLLSDILVIYKCFIYCYYAYKII